MSALTLKCVSDAIQKEMVTNERWNCESLAKVVIDAIKGTRNMSQSISDVAKQLAKQLTEHVLGPTVCPKCGNTKSKFIMLHESDPGEGCKEEGQCDWNMNYGIHTDKFDDPFKAKIDMLKTAEFLNSL